MIQWGIIGMAFIIGLTFFPTKGKSENVPEDPLDQMIIAFDGNFSRMQIKKRLERAMQLYNLSKTKENYSRAGSALVGLRKETGQKEMNILDYMIKSHVPGIKMDFPTAAGLAASFLSAGDDSISSKNKTTQGDVRNELIERCRAEMSEYGSAMVKACVDQDLEAFNALEKYSDEFKELKERCIGNMMQYGWNMVKACTDQDIEAKASLQKYPSDYKSFIARCLGQMGAYGWNMVKACVDQDIAAEKALRGY